MATCTQLSFSAEQLKEQVHNAVQLALDRTVAEVKTWKYFEDAMTEPISRPDGTIGYRIESQQLKAWLYYYGTGRYMEQDNPSLEQYKDSGFWNPLRPSSGDIVRWGSKDTHTLPNWKGKGTIEYKGADPAGQRVSKGQPAKGDFDAQLKQAGELFKRNLQENLAKVNIKNCIISSTKNV